MKLSHHSLISSPSRTLSRHATVFALLFSTGSLKSSAIASTDSKILKRIQAQVVHRHGDRSPITPLQDEAYWSKQLIPEATLAQIGANTVLKEEESNAHHHPAQGRGPFGKLSSLGLLQMVKLGNKLREELVNDNGNIKEIKDKQGRKFHPFLWDSNRPLQSSDIRVISTDFQRTIQSVQGVLVGFFPDQDDNSPKIEIDVRHTNIMIPDPVPRGSKEQEILEEQLAVRPHVIAREREMLTLAARATKALHPLLAADAHEAAFGSPEQAIVDHPSEMSIEVEPLSWNQLAEVTKCLSVREMLPEGITAEDCEAIIQHAAWKWFEAWRNPRLSYLSMNNLVSKQVKYMQDYVQNHDSNQNPDETMKPLTIWSAHDSTLIGLMCAYRLEQPAKWPEYGSYLMIELLQAQDEIYNKNDYFVRFSLNGEILRSDWEDDDEEPAEMIRLSTLAHKIRTVGAEPSVSSRSG